IKYNINRRIYMKEPRFFRCVHCGNIITKLKDSGVRVVCCNEEMKELEANTMDGAREKHLPFVTVKENTVKAVIGEVIHPMTEAHYIEWIYVQTTSGGSFKFLEPNDAPEAEFALVD